MYTIRKSFKAEYSHQLDSSFSTSCNENIHGHSATIEIFFQSGYLNKDNMVIDFGLVKAKIGQYIDTFDHSLIVSKNLISKYPELKKHNKKLKVVDYNPTAEAMAKDIYCNVKELMNDILSSNLRLYEVRFHETSTGWASFREN